MGLTTAKIVGLGGLLLTAVLLATIYYEDMGIRAASIPVVHAPITAQVRKENFDLSIVESGILEARRSITIASALPSNRAKIIWMVPEGSFVDKDEVIVKFDPAPFKDDILTLENELDEATGALAQGEQELQLEIQQAKAEADAKKHQIQVAELELENLSNADVPMRLAKTQNDLHSAKQAYHRANQNLKDLNELFKQGFGKQHEIDEAQEKTEESKAEFDYQKNYFKLLKEQITPAEIRQAKLKLSEQKRAASDQTKISQHKIALRNAALIRLRAHAEQLEKSLNNAKALVDKTEIKAPASGFLVYKKIATQGENRKVQIGDSVWFGNGFMMLPDMSEIITKLEVRETEIGQMQVGQIARIRPEAYPNLKLTGHIETIGTLAKSSKDGPPRFLVRIVLNDVDKHLRPGMTAKVTIQTGKYKDTVRIPVEAVFFNDDQAFCYRKTALGSEITYITLGQTDGDYVVVTDGLKGGEELMLNPPESDYDIGKPS
jgi:HlyD family secretion protein